MLSIKSLFLVVLVVVAGVVATLAPTTQAPTTAAPTTVAQFCSGFTTNKACLAHHDVCQWRGKGKGKGAKGHGCTVKSGDTNATGAPHGKPVG
jgi:hypothetical protein